MLYVRLIKSCLSAIGLFCFLSAEVLAGSQTVVKASVVEDDDSVYPNYLYVAGELANAGKAYVDDVAFGNYGYFFINDKGRWVYITEKNRTEIQRLGKGDYLTDSFSVSDVNGAKISVLINIKGVNDKAVISGNSAAVVWEDDVGRSSFLRASGRLKVSDVDAGESGFVSSSQSAHYGQLRINEAGRWVYKVENSLPIIQALADGDSLTESFVVKSIDGTRHKIVATIRGVNDLAQVSGVDVATVTKDGDGQYKGFLLANGQLEVTDKDSGEAAFVGAFSVGHYGYFYIDSTGQWGYLARNGAVDIQSLSKGEFLEDSFSVSTMDGTSHTVKVKILGLDEVVAKKLVAKKPLRLTWSAPFTRANGEPLSLSEIGGYHVYYGSRSGDYIYDVDIKGGDVQSMVFPGQGAGTFYIVITTYDSDGRESQYSDEFVLTLQ